MLSRRARARGAPQSRRLPNQTRTLAGRHRDRAALPPSSCRTLTLSLPAPTTALQPLIRRHGGPAPLKIAAGTCESSSRDPQFWRRLQLSRRQCLLQLSRGPKLLRCRRAFFHLPSHVLPPRPSGEARGGMDLCLDASFDDGILPCFLPRPSVKYDRSHRARLPSNSSVFTKNNLTGGSREVRTGVPGPPGPPTSTA